MTDSLLKWTLKMRVELYVIFYNILFLKEKFKKNCSTRSITKMLSLPVLLHFIDNHNIEYSTILRRVVHFDSDTLRAFAAKWSHENSTKCFQISE